MKKFYRISVTIAVILLALSGLFFFGGVMAGIYRYGNYNSDLADFVEDLDSGLLKYSARFKHMSVSRNGVSFAENKDVAFNTNSRRFSFSSNGTSKLVIDINNTDIYFESTPGDMIIVTVRGNVNIHCREMYGTIQIDPWSDFMIFGDYPTVTIEVPKGFKFSNVDITLDSGNIYANSLITDNTGLYLKGSSVTFKDSLVSETKTVISLNNSKLFARCIDTRFLTMHADRSKFTTGLTRKLNKAMIDSSFSSINLTVAKELPSSAIEVADKFFSKVSISYN